MIMYSFTDWSEVFLHTEVNSAVISLHLILHRIFDLYVSIKKESKRRYWPRLLGIFIPRKLLVEQWGIIKQIRKVLNSTISSGSGFIIRSVEREYQVLSKIKINYLIQHRKLWMHSQILCRVCNIYRLALPMIAWILSSVTPQKGIKLQKN